MQQRRHTRENVPAPEHGLAVVHQLRDGVLPIPDALLELRGDQRDCFGLVEAQAPGEAFLRKEPGLEGSAYR
jgi:hypothetical protein